MAEPGPIDSLSKLTYHAGLPTLLVQVALDVLGQVAQLVEHWTENPGVGGSTPPLTTPK